MRVKILLARAYQRFMTVTSGGGIKLDRTRPNAVIMLVPDYGNIGDLAIGYAQERFLELNAPHFSVQSVPIRNTYRVLRSLRRQLRPRDIVFLVGGGSMGDLYPRAQLGREFVAQYLRGQRIISFPQSIIYMDRPDRESSARREARALAKSAGWLALFAREKTSYSMMKGFFPGNVGFAPDIVLSLITDYQSLPEESREGVLLALRTDTERALTPADHERIRRVAGSHGTIIDRDHGVPNDEVDQTDSYKLPLATLDLYRNVSLVVTDRLHGMIFAAVTGTPCVVLPNTNHKITGTYEDWVSEQCPYISLIADTEEGTLIDAIRRVMSPESKHAYRSAQFDFNELRQAISGSRSTPSNAN